MIPPHAATTPSRAPADASWQVYCLCAAWCGVCGQWRSDFAELALAHPALHFSWIDIEDQADVLGEVEVETFPTLLVAQGSAARFFGAVPPHPATVARLLASLQADGNQAPDRVSSELLARLQRLS